MLEPRVQRLCSMPILEANSQRVGGRECLPPLQLIRGNSVPALTGGKRSLLVCKSMFPALSLRDRPWTAAATRVLSSPQTNANAAASTDQCGRTEGWNPKHEPREQKVPALALCMLPWAPALRPAAKEGWPPSRKLWQPPLRALPVDNSTPWPRLLPL